MSLFFCFLTLSSDAADSLTTIPLIGRAPVIDGAIDAKEWGGAAILQPLVRPPDATIEGFSTRVSLAWTPDLLFVAIQHQRPPQAPMVTGPKTKDQLIITLAAPNRKTVKLIAWGGVVRLEPDNKSATPASQQVGTTDTYGWATEASLPLDRLCTRDQLLASGLNLDIELREPSIGAAPKRLTQQLRFMQRQLAVRFLSAGEFEGGQNQGCMIELVNADEQPANLSVKVDVSPKDADGRRFETEKMILPGNALRRVRLASPVTRGEFRATYQLSVDGSPFAKGGFVFNGVGPMQVSVIPFHLWRRGVFVRSSIASDTNTVTYSYSVKAADTQSLVLGQTTGKGSDMTEYFLPTSQLHPAPYFVIVTATRDGSVLAERKIVFIRPEYPKWWGQR